MQKAFHQSILQRMEGNDNKPPTGTEQISRLRQSFGKGDELLVDCDAQRLEDARRRVYSVPMADDACDQAGQLPGSGQGTSCHDGAGDAARVPFLSEFPEESGELLLRESVDEIGSRSALISVEPHIEWPF